MDNFKNELQKDAGQELPKKDPEKDPVIKILDILPNSTDLLLSDDGYTVAEKNTKVTWEVHTNKVIAITGIERKSDSEDVFKEDAQPAEETKKKWSGKTKDKVYPKDDRKYVREYYTIHYIDYGGNPVEYDPIIQVNA